MTTLTPPANRIGPAQRARWAVTDALTVAWRNGLQWIRLPQLIVFSTIQPVMFVLLFNFVFGGAIEVPTGNYIDFLMPGIFVHTVTFGATQTGVALADDLAKGIVDRFRSLPMARSAVLAGRTIADAGRGLFVVTLMIIVAHLIGFRFHAGPLAAIGAILLVVAFGFAMSWIAAVVGLSVNGVEAAQAASFVWVFPLVFASSAFVPTDGMPGWLQVFANNQPVSRVVDAARVLILGGPATRPVLIALAWIAGMLAVAVPLAVSRYRRAT